MTSVIPEQQKSVYFKQSGRENGGRAISEKSGA